MPVDSSGNIYGVGISPGVSMGGALSRPGFTAVSAPAGTSADASTLGSSSSTVVAPAFQSPGGSPTWWAVGLVGLVVAMHVIEREREEIDGKILGLNIWNFLATGLMASTFILTTKIGAYKWAPNSAFARVAGAI